MEGEIVVFKADVCLRAFWHCRRKKKYSQSKGFKESQSAVFILHAIQQLVFCNGMEHNDHI